MKPKPSQNSTLTEIQSKAAFEEAFNAHYEKLCAFAFFYLKDKAASEEVVQEVFFILWKKRAEIVFSSSVKSYLYQATKNQCLNVLKHIDVREAYKKSNELQRNATSLYSTDWLETQELEKKIIDAIHKLPDERKKIFMLSRYEEMKYREIAEKLNISIKTVEAQMGKALKFLRVQLAEYLPIWFILSIFLK